MKKLTITIFIITFSLLGLGCAQQDVPEEPNINDVALNDSDKDGVIDARDTCPETAITIEVSNNGCPIWNKVEKIKEMVIFFEVSSSKVNDKYLESLKSKLEYVNGHKGTSILLEGYTSDIGSVEINSKLQMERAHAVKSLLVSLGANPEDITIHNQGTLSENIKVKDNKMHNANQRVFIKIIKLDIETQEKWSFMTN